MSQARADRAGDQQLIEQARAGDAGAFATLVRRYERRAYRAATSVLGARADAHDVVQIGWLRAFESLSCYNGRACFGTWLYRIVVNAARDHLRRADERHVRAGEMIELLAERAAPLRHDELERRWLRRQLERAIASLPEHQREPFVLFYRDGLKAKEIAQRLGLTKTTVLVRLHYARRRLRAKLSVHG